MTTSRCHRQLLSPTILRQTETESCELLEKTLIQGNYMAAFLQIQRKCFWWVYFISQQILFMSSDEAITELEESFKFLTLQWLHRSKWQEFRGETALDVFERQKEATDFEIGIMLCIAGALRASSCLVLRNYLLFLLLKGKCQSDERNAILEVAVLLVTTT